MFNINNQETGSSIHSKKIYIFELWCWRRIVWIPWAAEKNKYICICIHTNSKYIKLGRHVHWKHRQKGKRKIDAK